MLVFTQTVTYIHNYFINCTSTIIEGPNVIYLPGLTLLPIKLTCNVTGTVIGWSVNGVDRFVGGALMGHNIAGID